MNEALVLHLVLKHQYYDAIDRGEKTVEYRDNTEYWRRRIADKEQVISRREERAKIPLSCSRAFAKVCHEALMEKVTAT